MPFLRALPRLDARPRPPRAPRVAAEGGQRSPAREGLKESEGRVGAVEGREVPSIGGRYEALHSLPQG